jgi:group I intron endonuclease
MNSGIYQIRNIVSGRIYVGSAADIDMRWHNHRYRLRKGNHHSASMQRSWNKHGPAAFSFEIIELCEPTDFVKREQFWMDDLKACDPRRGFNICPASGSPLGRRYKQTEEARANIAKSNADRNKTPEMRALSSARAARRNKTSLGKKRNSYSQDRLAKLRAAQPIKKGDTRLSKSTEKQSATMKLKDERRVKAMMWHDFALVA